jgi:hypothetical protein
MTMTPNEAIAKVFEEMDEHSAYGASDTEPRAVFAQILSEQLAGLDPYIPTTAEGWQLYSDMRGSACVAGKLAGAAASAVKAMNGDHRGAVEAVRYYYGGLL